MNFQQNCKENEKIFEKLFQVIKSSDSNLDIKIKKQFSALPCTVSKVDFVLNILENYNIFPTYIRDCKNSNESSDFRAKGNKLYSLKKYEEALEMYTYSIAVAEDKSENLGIAFANRSAVLFRLGFFQECLRDIENALENNYPKSLLHKIVERKQKAVGFNSKQNIICYHQPLPTIKENDQNSIIECASKCVEIRQDKNQGRFLVATRDIEIGEIIAVEHPSFTTLSERKWCHCYHCLKLCYNLLPCTACTKAMFCSVKCRKEAFYHDYECPIFTTIESLGFNACRFLPLRIAISMNREELNVQLQKSDEDYKSGRYKELNNLVTNEEHRTVDDLFERAICTAIFYKLVEDHTEFFKKDVLAKEEFIKLLFRHLQIMACNFHDINEMCQNSNGIYESCSIGAGAYAFLSLFNHSCTPNVCRASYGTAITVFTIQTVKKGEQLFDNYGFHFAVHPKSTRQASLKKQYYFECKCKACTQNWPTLYNLEKQRDIIPFWEEYLGDLSDANLEEARKIRPNLISALKRLERDVPTFEFCIVQEMLKQCDGIFGNIRRSLKTTL